MVVMTNEEKKIAYELMLAQAKVLFANEDNALANFANALSSFKYNFAKLCVYRFLSDG